METRAILLRQFPFNIGMNLPIICHKKRLKLIQKLDIASEVIVWHTQTHTHTDTHTHTYTHTLHTTLLNIWTPKHIYERTNILSFPINTVKFGDVISLNKQCTTTILLCISPVMKGSNEHHITLCNWMHRKLSKDVSILPHCQHPPNITPLYLVIGIRVLCYWYWSRRSHRLTA